jgi:hypothetical protein
MDKTQAVLFSLDDYSLTTEPNLYKPLYPRVSSKCKQQKYILYALVIVSVETIIATFPGWQQKTLVILLSPRAACRGCVRLRKTALALKRCRHPLFAKFMYR